MTSATVMVQLPEALSISADARQVPLALEIVERLQREINFNEQLHLQAVAVLEEFLKTRGEQFNKRTQLLQKQQTLAKKNLETEI